MDFLNHTPYQSRLLRLDLWYRDLLQATVIAKATFDVALDGSVELSSEPIPILEEDVETPFGMVEQEQVPIKAWCDVALLGCAWTPLRDEPVARSRVSLSIGRFERSAIVSGDRFWVRSAFGFEATPPIPFWQLPLTHELSYGGNAVHDGQLAQYFDNPEGRGFVLEVGEVEGTPLPNIEEPDQLVRNWSEQPLPAALAPLSRFSALRGKRGIRVEQGSGVERLQLEASSFCFAHPRMHMESYPDGARVGVEGARPDGIWSFRLPRFRPVAELELGGQHYVQPLTPDTLYLLPEERKLVVVARTTFIYHFLPERLRSIQLRSDQQLRSPRGATSIRAARGGGHGLAIELEPSDPLELPLDELERTYPLSELTENFPLCVSG